MADFPFRIDASTTKNSNYFSRIFPSNFPIFFHKPSLWSHTQFWPDRFSRFDTNGQTNIQAPIEKQSIYIFYNLFFKSKFSLFIDDIIVNTISCKLPIHKNILNKFHPDLIWPSNFSAACPIKNCILIFLTKSRVL